MGEGSLLLRCLEHWRGKGLNVRGVASSDVDVRTWADAAGVSFVRLNHLDRQVSLKAIETFIEGDEFDFLFSITNPLLLPTNVLGKANRLAINYHDGPLPRYAGVHATSWAILNGESDHGITWHSMEVDADTGRILVQRRFDVPADATAFTLNTCCFEEAFPGFVQLTERLEVGDLSGSDQRLQDRTYFSKHQKPAGGGVIDWNRTGNEILRLIRACDFGQVPNGFATAKLALANDMLVVRFAKIVELNEPASPGTIIAVSPRLVVATSDGALDIGELLTLSGDSVRAAELGEHGIACGARLPRMDADEVGSNENLVSALSRRDSFWVHHINNRDPIPVPALGESMWTSSGIQVPDDWNGDARVWKLSVIAAFLGRFGASGNGHFGWLRERATTKNCFFDDRCVPVAVANEDVSSVVDIAVRMAKFAAPIEGVIASPDLGARYAEVQTAARSLEDATFPVRCRCDGDADFEFYGPPALAAALVCFADQCASDLDGDFRAFEFCDQASSSIVTGTEVAPDDSVIDVFRSVVLNAPDKIAFETSDCPMTYRELDERSDCVARALRLGGVSDGFVGLCISRGADQITAILGILKTGAAYLPLDAAWPTARLKAIVGDAAPRIILVDESAPKSISELGFRVIAVADALSASHGTSAGDRIGGTPKPEDIAYAMFTSGSTGVPKGVCVEHRSIVRLVRNPDYCEFSQDERILCFAPISFDASTFEIWGALLNGGTLVLADAGSPDLGALAETISSRRVSTLWLTAGLFNQMVDTHLDCFSRVRQLLTGGDVLSVPHVRRFEEIHANVRLINGYGPTENTTFTTCQTITPADLKGRSIPIGSPINGTCVFILDKRLKPVPRGVLGELCVGGIGLARGYLGRPELTTERFVEVEVAGATRRLYRTGDHAAIRDDGVVVFAGRSDAQVKVNGHRIELEEIEAVLGSHSLIARAGVKVVGGDGQKALAAFVVAKPEVENDEDALRSFLEERLPRYSVPQILRFVTNLPLNANGKIDRARLPEIDLGEEQRTVEAFQPKDKIEESLLEMWRQVLGVRSIGAEESFLSLGGHSLKAMRLASAISERFGVKVPISVVFEQATLAELAAWIRECAVDSGGDGPLPRADRSRPLPLASNQRSLWVAWKLAPASPVYNIAHSIELRGDISVDAIHKALRGIVSSHEMLRARILETNGEPFIEIVDSVEVALPVDDIAGDVGIADRIATEDSLKPFDLSAPGLFRFRLIRMGAREFRLVVVFHHIIADGESVRIFADELIERLRGEHRVSDAGLEFVDFVAEQRAAHQSGKMDDHLAYWRAMLSRRGESAELPFDHRGLSNQAFEGGRSGCSFSEDESRSIVEACAALEVTPHAFFLALHAAFLRRYSSASNISVGIPVANRGARGSERVFGFFANTAALVIDVDVDDSFGDLVTACSDQVREALVHEVVGVEHLASETGMDAVPFESMFAYEDQETELSDDSDVQATIEEIVLPIAKFDLTLEIRRCGGVFHTAFEYRADLFESSTVEALLENLHAFACAASKNLESQVGALPVIGSRDRMLLEALVDITANGEETATTVLDEIAARIAETPDGICIVDGDRKWTFAELDSSARAVGRCLRSLGAGPEIVVAVSLPRSADLVVVALGVLHAGAAFLPIDPANPSDRVELLLQDSKAICLIAQDDCFPEIPVRRLTVADACSHAGDESLVKPHVGSLAYVIYTSGSTGAPKGVCVTHAPLLNHNVGIRSLLALTKNDVALQFASPGFDVAWEEVLTTLASGACLVPCNASMLESQHSFLKEIERLWVTVLNLPTAFWDSLVAEALENNWRFPSCVRLIIVGGERVSAQSLARWQKLGLDRVRLLNGYGPTEATITSTIHEVRNATNWQTMREVPIGRPLPGVAAAVVNRSMKPVPVGAKGELLLGGACLARGYMGRDDLTDSAFVQYKSLIGVADRFYRTGDVVRVRRDGELEFHGRVDEQIKLRGFRIEPVEVESALSACQEVGECAVLLHESEILVAFVEPESNPVSESQIRDRLASRLPSHMIPDRVVMLDRMPVTLSGKIDRKTLAACALNEEVVEEEGFVTEVESDLAAVWCDLLGTDVRSRGQSFLSLGGNSLTAMSLVARIETRFGVKLPIRDVLERPMLRDMAGAVERESAATCGSREEGFI